METSDTESPGGGRVRAEAVHARDLQSLQLLRASSSRRTDGRVSSPEPWTVPALANAVMLAAADWPRVSVLQVQISIAVRLGPVALRSR